jgi:hypothetical protein
LGVNPLGEREVVGLNPPVIPKFLERTQVNHDMDFGYQPNRTNMKVIVYDSNMTPEKKKIMI